MDEREERERHPAFDAVLRTESREGVTVDLAEYRQTPDYVGGRYVEVYVDTGGGLILFDEDFGEWTPDVLDRAVEDYLGSLEQPDPG